MSERSAGFPAHIQIDSAVDSAAGSETRVFLTTGIAQFVVSASSPNGSPVSETQSVKLLVDPVIAPGKFRKATGVVGLADLALALQPTTPGLVPVGNAFGGRTFEIDTSAVQPRTGTWCIDEIATSQDDESGKVELRFEVTVSSSGVNSAATMRAVTFQVTTLATII
jgi:hypothetical protein